MSWQPNFSYIKSAFQDGKDAFKFMKKKKGSLKVGELGKSAEAFNSLVDVNKQTRGFNN